MVKALVCAAIIIALTPFCAFAQGEAVEDGFQNLLDGLPNDIAELLPDNVLDGLGSVGEGARELSSWEFIIDTVLRFFGFGVKEAVSAFISICALLVLCSLLNLLKKTFKNDALQSAIGLACAIALASLMSELCIEPLKKSIYVLEDIKIFVNTSSPLICALYAVGGNVNNALVHNYGLIVFLTLLENVCILSFKTMVCVCLSLSFASMLMGGSELIPLSNAVKKIFSFAVGLTMVVFTGVISSQTLLADKADSISSKTAKIIASQMIPLVGGTIGDSLKTAGASVEYLRSSVGVVLIVILLLTVAPSILTLLAYRASFALAQGMSGLLNCEREGKMIGEIASVYGYVLAILSFCSVVLLLLITVFTKCASPLR